MNPIVNAWALIIDLLISQNAAIVQLQQEVALDNALDIPQAQMDALQAAIAALQPPGVQPPDTLG